MLIFKVVRNCGDVIVKHSWGFFFVLVPSRYIVSPQSTRENTSAKDLQEFSGELQSFVWLPCVLETYQIFEAKQNPKTKSKQLVTLHSFL